MARLGDPTCKLRLPLLAALALAWVPFSAAAQEKCPAGPEIQEVLPRRDARSLLQAKQEVLAAKQAPVEHIEPGEEAPPLPPQAPAEQPPAVAALLLMQEARRALQFRGSWRSMRGTAAARLVGAGLVPQDLLPRAPGRLLGMLQASAPARKGGEEEHRSGASPGTDTPREDDAWAALVAQVVASLVYVVLILCCGFLHLQLYHAEALEAGSPLKPPGIEELPTETFRFGMFDCEGCCGRDVVICACGFLCTGIRWADTLSQRKVGLGYSFWTLLLFWAMCTGLDEVSIGVSSVIFLVFAVYSRQRLRAAFGLKHGTAGTCVKDCLTWACCFPCAAVQEAREVEYLPISRA